MLKEACPKHANVSNPKRQLFGLLDAAEIKKSIPDWAAKSTPLVAKPATVAKTGTKMTPAKTRTKTAPVPAALKVDQKTEITLSDFLEALCVEHWSPQELFRAVDADDNKSLSAEEVKNFLKTSKDTTVGKQLINSMKSTMQQCILTGTEEKLFSSLDSDSSNAISEDEFVAALFIPSLHIGTLFRSKYTPAIR